MDGPEVNQILIIQLVFKGSDYNLEIIAMLAGQLRLYSYNGWLYSETTMINETQHMATVIPTINLFAVYQ